MTREKSPPVSVANPSKSSSEKTSSEKVQSEKVQSEKAPSEKAQSEKRHEDIPDIVEATARYEAWLGHFMKCVPREFRHKHQEMAHSPLTFFKATFYRWAQRFPRVCPELTQVTHLLAIGDLHLHAFGTWRDSEGRLVWGVNELEESCRLPWTQDLVRLATSLRLAVAEGCLPVPLEAAFERVLEGYHKGIRSGGRPLVLGADGPVGDTGVDKNAHLLELVQVQLPPYTSFWQALEALPDYKRPLPDSLVRALNRRLPKEDDEVRVARRLGPIGTWGRPRFVAHEDWRGGKIAREASAYAPSAVHWAENTRVPQELPARELNADGIRSRDPRLKFGRHWTVRRLSPDCRAVEPDALAKSTQPLDVLYSMGAETANLHLGNRKARGIREELQRLPAGWLAEASALMEAAVREDFGRWQARQTPPEIAID